MYLLLCLYNKTSMNILSGKNERKAHKFQPENFGLVFLQNRFAFIQYFPFPASMMDEPWMDEVTRLIRAFFFPVCWSAIGWRWENQRDTVRREIWGRFSNKLRHDSGHGKGFSTLPASLRNLGRGSWKSDDLVAAYLAGWRDFPVGKWRKSNVGIEIVRGAGVQFCCFNELWIVVVFPSCLKFSDSKGCPKLSYRLSLLKKKVSRDSPYIAHFILIGNFPSSVYIFELSQDH